MLFDLKGKRRRTVQATYLTLAVLMGAGLVLFGIGSSVNGGLGDLFGGGGGSNQADKAIQKKIDEAQKTLQRDPKNAAAMSQLVRSHYQLATSKQDANSQFTAGAKPELQETAAAWKRYESAVKKPSAATGTYALRAFEGLALLTPNAQDQQPYWAGAADTAETLAQAKPSSNAYVALVQYATLAGQDRKATLAGQQAIRLAPKSQKKTVKQDVAQAKQARQQLQQQQQQQSQGAQG